MIKSDTNMRGPVSIEPNIYGASTAAINYLLKFSDSLELFPAVRNIPDEVYCNIRLHLRKLGVLSSSGDTPTPLVVLGCESVLMSVAGVLDVTFGEIENRDQWRKKTGELIAAMESGVTESRRNDVFHPPLWPIIGNPGVVQQLVAYKWGGVPGAECSAQEHVVWALICQLEELVWNAITWERLSDGSKSNPFDPILENIRLGIYPLGLWNECFVCFGSNAESKIGR